MHQFYLGQAVEYHPPRGTYVPTGMWTITAKLPERNGEYYYRIRHPGEPHERMVREGELNASPGWRRRGSRTSGGIDLARPSQLSTGEYLTPSPSGPPLNR
jgi:hypothetical protein